MRSGSISRKNVSVDMEAEAIVGIITRISRTEYGISLLNLLVSETIVNRNHTI